MATTRTKRTAAKRSGAFRQFPSKKRKEAYSKVPRPQRERIKAKYIAGKNKTQIGREEHRHRETVANIVNEPDVAEYVKKLRAKWYGSIEKVLKAAVMHAINGADGGKLAYQMCIDAGVIPREVVKPPVVEVLDPIDEQTAVKRIAQRMIEGAIERHKFFELPFPEADEAEEELKAERVKERDDE